MEIFDRRTLLVSWVGFTGFLVILQFVVNRVFSGFALLTSALGAVPVALIIAWKARKRSGS